MMRRLIVGWLLVTLLSGCATALVTGAADRGYQPVDDRTEAEVRADATISAAVNRRLVHDRQIPAMAVHVTTYRGVVTLSGQVPSRFIAQRAAALAGSVAGVRRVNDSLTTGE